MRATVEAAAPTIQLDMEKLHADVKAAMAAAPAIQLDDMFNGLFTFPPPGGITMEMPALQLDLEKMRADMEAAGMLQDPEAVKATQARLALEQTERERARVDQFLADCQLYIGDYFAYKNKYPDRNARGSMVNLISRMREQQRQYGGLETLLSLYETRLANMSDGGPAFILYQAGPLSKTPEGRELYAATLLNLKPADATVTNTAAMRAWDCYYLFKFAADPDYTWQKYTDEGAGGPNSVHGATRHGVMMVESGHPSIAWFAAGAGYTNRLSDDAAFWDFPGAFYPFDATNPKAYRVWVETMAQFYGALPTPPNPTPAYKYWAEQNYDRLAFAAYGSTLAELFTQLPDAVKVDIVAHKMPYYTTLQAKEKFQTETGRNLENATIFCRWVFDEAADIDNPPVYRKEVKPPSTKDQIIAFLLNIAGTVMAFVGVPPAIGALSVAASKVVEIYTIEQMEKIDKENRKAQEAQVAAQKEVAAINEQLARLEKERRQLQTGQPVKANFNRGRQALTLGAAAFLLSMVL